MTITIISSQWQGPLDISSRNLKPILKPTQEENHGITEENYTPRR